MHDLDGMSSDVLAMEAKWLSGADWYMLAGIFAAFEAVPGARRAAPAVLVARGCGGGLAPEVLVARGGVSGDGGCGAERVSAASALRPRVVLALTAHLGHENGPQVQSRHRGCKAKAVSAKSTRRCGAGTLRRHDQRARHRCRIGRGAENRPSRYASFSMSVCSSRGRRPARLRASRKIHSTWPLAERISSLAQRRMAPQISGSMRRGYCLRAMTLSCLSSVVT